MFVAQKSFVLFSRYTNVSKNVCCTEKFFVLTIHLSKNVCCAEKVTFVLTIHTHMHENVLRRKGVFTCPSYFPAQLSAARNRSSVENANLPLRLPVLSRGPPNEEPEPPATPSPEVQGPHKRSLPELCP
eukprot:GEMP01071159.1.p2 GENE.GEMP01071159.1~~GEMP01071159.1.p2  ORF type:complete len:129 (-),score=4.20 GEMP01071159.1:763-1149(-)